MFLLAPSVARPQTTQFTTNSLDAWRSQLTERLDENLARLGQEPTATSAPTKSQQAAEHSQPGNPLPLSLAEFRFASRRAVINAPWLEQVAAILREQGVPSGLMGVMAVESGFNPRALSPKGARGLWQLMPETARRFGLEVSARRDERIDPLKSTFAAVQYLKVLYAQFGDWPLVLAAYNSGEDRIQRLLDRFRVSDFWTLRRLAALPDETRRYVPTVLGRSGSALSTFNPAFPSVPGLPPRESHMPARWAEPAVQVRVVFALTSQISAAAQPVE